KATAQLLSQIKTLEYCGYIEGDALFSGIADLVVCDGFVGNVALKTTEGVAKFIMKTMKDAFSRNLITKLMGLLVKPILRPLIKRIDPGRYNGATFVGLNGIVIKSHGSANSSAFTRAIEEAVLQVKSNVPDLIRHEVEQPLKPTEGC